MTKKLIALLLAIAMAGCFFTACKGNETSSPDPGKTDPPSSETATPPTETPTQPVDPNKPLYTFTKANVNEEAKTCYAGAIVIDRTVCPIEDENKQITEIVIPSEIDGYKVVGITWDVMGQKGGGQGFLTDPENNDSIKCSATKIVIPATVEKIEYGAFWFGAGNVTEVVFEDKSNIKEIQDYAFLGTKWIAEEADKNDGFVIINGILIHAAVTGDDLLTLPSDVKVVTYGLWKMADSDLTYGCEDYKAIVVNDGCEEIKSKAFYMSGADSAWWVRIPESVTKIADDAIDDGWAADEKLARVCVKKGSYAEEWATKNGYSVVYEVTKGSEDETWALENRHEYVYPDEKYSFVVSSDGYGIEKPIDKENKTVGVAVMINRNLVSFKKTAKEVRELVIPEKIGDYTVTGVGGDFRGEKAWGGAIGFDINLSAPKKDWGDRSICEMDLQCNLTKVEFPATLKEIGYRALDGIYAKELEEVVFNGTDNIVKVGKTPFKATLWEVIAAGDAESGILVLKNWAVYISCDMEEIIIPDGVEYICCEACHENENAGSNDYSTVKVIRINDGCKKIESAAFGKCSDVEDIYIPASVTSIEGNSLFNDWSEDENKVKSSAKVHVVKGSYADEWATSRGYTVVYAE